jgi:hypothetical protein
MQIPDQVSTRESQTTSVAHTHHFDRCTYEKADFVSIYPNGRPFSRPPASPVPAGGSDSLAHAPMRRSQVEYAGIYKAPNVWRIIIQNLLSRQSLLNSSECPSQ